MTKTLVKATIIVPGTVLIFIPAAIIYFSRSTRFAAVLCPGPMRFWLAMLLAGTGLSLSVWCASLFIRLGNGTPAPWAPPRKLVIRGPYRHVRNPMISGVLTILAAEAVFFQSWLLGLWAIIFFVANSLYFPCIEEKGLEKRFGDDYRLYKANVPRWLPRLTPWSLPEK